LKKGSEKIKRKVEKGRELSQRFVRNFEKLGKAALAGGGSVSYEWPRHCDGWRDPTVEAMVHTLGLVPVDIDGCAVGVRDSKGTPILKPWRFMVSSQSMASALEGLRCRKDHEHRRCSGGKLTASTAFYPEQLCEAIHEGLDRHERDREKPKNEATVSGETLYGSLCALAHQDFADAGQEDGSQDRPGHREKLDPSYFGVWTALVTRLIPSRSEEFRSPGRLKALKKELDTLRGQEVWDESSVTEWQELRAKSSDRDIMAGRLFAIMGEKGAELNRPAGEKVYKARVVFAGNNISTASGVPAWELFQEVSQTPAAMVTVRSAMAVAALKGMEPKMRDAQQAYIQARIDGPGRPETWVRLPKQWWPASWFGPSGEPLYRDPLVKLQKALYGHPESGALWDKHLGRILTDLGWTRIENHPGMWIHPASGAVMTVYVDDLMMAAPKEHEDSLWKAMELRVSFGEDPQPLGKFLGGMHSFTTHDGISNLRVEMEAFLRSAVDIFKAEAGITRLRPVRSPYLSEDFAAKGAEETGDFAGTASSHLMKILFAARLCRPDLLVAITRLASKASSWNKSHDRALHRLMAYIDCHTDLELYGTLAQSDLTDCIIAMSPDSDLAGDMETTKSTSGLWLEVLSADRARSWPLAWRSKRQGSTASSTCEAETISMANGLKQEALPILDLFEAALQRPVRLLCLEDNTQCIDAARRGYSQALRHLSRTERISLGVLSEHFADQDERYRLEYQSTELHKGDVFTNRLEPAPFEDAVRRMGLHKMCAVR